MRNALIFGVIGSLLAGCAIAADRGGRAERVAAAMHERFKQADENSDGLLSRDETKRKLPRVHAHFDEIDVRKTGALTEADVAVWVKSARVGRR